METLAKTVKFVQISLYRRQTHFINLVQVFLLLTLYIFHTFL